MESTVEKELFPVCSYRLLSLRRRKVLLTKSAYNTVEISSMLETEHGKENGDLID